MAFLFPEQAEDWSIWYIVHMPVIIPILFALDVVFWLAMYRRYRRKHPLEPIKLIPFNDKE